MSSQWENFLQNLGEWRGSFANLSLQGDVLNSVPSILTLEKFDDDQAVLFRLRRFAQGGYDTEPTQDYQQEYRHLGRQVIFFESGAFSKGSLQFAPFTEFGAEYGFVAGDRRFRLVQLYDTQGNFASLTLIREFRHGSNAQERPPLTPDQLIGIWQGTACTMYADWQNPTTCSTRLEIHPVGEHHLEQTLSFDDQHITSKARIEGNCLFFEAGDNPRQITLLPDGGSSNIPLQLHLRQPFFVEAGWFVTDTERQRLIRHYDNHGAWTGATHVIEHKVG
jgi:hypothetical protein